MGKWARWLAVALIAAAGCGFSSDLPRAGDEVKPALTDPIKWKAGQDRGSLWVDLQATDASGKSRRLGFRASPTHNPVANIEFFNADDRPIHTTSVELNQRC